MPFRNFPPPFLQHLKQDIQDNACDTAPGNWAWLPLLLQVLKRLLQLWLATWKGWKSCTGSRAAWRSPWSSKWAKSAACPWISSPSSSSLCHSSSWQQQLWAATSLTLLGGSFWQGPSPGSRWVLCGIFIPPSLCGVDPEVFVSFG